MIVTTGRIIKVDTTWDLHLERTSEKPGVVTVTRAAKGQEEQFIELPGNPHDAETFIQAYRRAFAEDVGYRESECEPIVPWKPALMPYRLVEERPQGNGRRAGIVETPCFPASFYAGGLNSDGSPERNDTCLFHRTIEEARKALDRYCQLPEAPASKE
jgi:hypothetical protein